MTEKENQFILVLMIWLWGSKYATDINFSESTKHGL